VNAFDMTQDEFESAQYDLGTCKRITAESIGSPGQRYFRLSALAELGSAIIWLEKEQLYQLAMSVKQLLRTEMKEHFEGETEPQTGVHADYDIKAAQLALGHDRESDLYLLMVHESINDSRAMLALWLDRQQLDSLADQAFWLCAAGRPRCPLCGAPINDTERHICARTNGHVKE
tara:strand:+ start:30 stop:554 length:525 start_codon:yes stop_codon:yes gene_type:complete